jgi:hypothetical protein
MKIWGYLETFTTFGSVTNLYYKPSWPYMAQFLFIDLKVWVRYNYFSRRTLNQNLNTMELQKSLEKSRGLHITIQALTLKLASCRSA